MACYLDRVFFVAFLIPETSRFFCAGNIRKYTGFLCRILSRKHPGNIPDNISLPVVRFFVVRFSLCFNAVLFFNVVEYYFSIKVVVLYLKISVECFFVLLISILLI